jgi:hypothetical protein
MPAQNPPLSDSERQNNVEITFIAACTTIGLVTAAIMPLIAYALIIGCSIAIYQASSGWSHWADLYAPVEENASYNLYSKIALGIGITIGAILFIELQFFSQIILATVASAIIGWTYVHEFVGGSQQRLNQALHSAVQEHRLDAVKTLLDRGADPCARDQYNQTPFDGATRAMHDALKASMNKPKLSFKSVLANGIELVDSDVRTAWKNTWAPFRAWTRENNQPNRAAVYHALVFAIQSHGPGLKKCLAGLTDYLRGQIAASNIPDAQLPPPRDVPAPEEMPPNVPPLIIHQQHQQQQNHPAAPQPPTSSAVNSGRRLR